MKGWLLPDFEVELHHTTTEVGGVWREGPGGQAVAWDQDLSAFFLERMLLYENPLVLDIGANTGSFCLLAKLHPGARIIAFEPSPVPFKILQNNIELNGLSDRVEARNYALADFNGRATFHEPNRGASGFGTLGQPATKWEFTSWTDIQVDVWRLDDLELPHVDLIKSDTEGCELFILKGGEKLIRRDKPELVLEYENRSTHQFGYSTPDITKLLKNWGYSEFKGVGRRVEGTDQEDLWARHLGEGMTMFTTFKPFTGEAAIIQRNALKNWISLEPRPEIIVFGDEEGVAEVCQELCLIHVPDIQRSAGGKPLLNVMITMAESMASSNLLVYCDGDVIFRGLVEAASVASEAFDEFVLVTHRRNVHVTEEIDFEKSEWIEPLVSIPTSPPCAIDFFLFTKGFWPEVPPFAIAGFALDNWLVEDALTRGKVVIDATLALFQYHQNHAPPSHSGPDYQRNRELFGGDPTLPRGFVTHAPWVLDENGIRKR